MTAPHFDEDHDLVEKCKTGCHDSFTELVNKYYAVIYSRACSFLNDEEEARDLTQDIFVDILKAIPSFRGDSLFFTWMYQIATFKCKARLAYLIRRGYADSVRVTYDENEEDSSEQEYYLSPEEVTFENERRAIIHCCLDKLPEVDRKILTMMYLNEYPRIKIAQKLGLPECYVKWKLETARRLMRKYLTDYMDVSEIWHLRSGKDTSGEVMEWKAL